MTYKTSNSLKQSSGSEGKPARARRQNQVGYTSFSGSVRKNSSLSPISKDGNVHRSGNSIHGSGKRGQNPGKA